MKYRLYINATNETVATSDDMKELILMSKDKKHKERLSLQIIK